MGGHAFQATLGANALFPRMTHATYQRLKTFCVSKLQNYFNYVEVAPEDPEKLDYGDLDVLVFDQKGAQSHVSLFVFLLIACATSERCKQHLQPVYFESSSKGGFGSGTYGPGRWTFILHLRIAGIPFFQLVRRSRSVPPSRRKYLQNPRRFRPSFILRFLR